MAYIERCAAAICSLQLFILCLPIRNPVDKANNRYGGASKSCLDSNTGGAAEL